MTSVGDYSTVVAIAMSETSHKENDVLQVLEPISRDGIFPQSVFVPPQIQEWFHQLLNTRKQLLRGGQASSRPRARRRRD